MKTVSLGKWTSTDAKRNRFRYYHLYLTEDLWGRTCLVKAWGRIGQGGRQKVYWPASDEELAQLLQEEILRRKKRGYVPRFSSPQCPTLIHRSGKTRSTNAYGPSTT
jgi:predicted DNA-binding WGR domain protein